MVWIRTAYCALFALVLASLSGGTAAGADADAELIQLVVNLLGDKDKDVRSLGLEQVRSEAKGEDATRQFAAQLPKLASDAQVGLLGALADRKDPAARPAVVELLGRSRDAEVRVAAIAALGDLGSQADLGLLVPLLADAPQPEQQVARTSLQRLRDERVNSALAEKVGSGPAGLRVALIEILAVRRAREARDAMLTAGVDADPKVRAAAMKALGELAGPQQLPGMVQGVLKAESGVEREAAERAVAAVCLRLPKTESQAAPLLVVMDKLTPADQIALLSTLGRVGGAVARTRIEAAIADADPGVHARGMRAICNWPDATVAARLVELAKSEPHPDHRAMALGALIRVAPLPDKRTAQERLDLTKTAMGLCTKDSQRNTVLKRASAIRTVESLRYLVGFMDQPALAQQACESIVELAHHRDLREPNKAEFHRALDEVLRISTDATVKDRAQRYKNNQTWVRPKKGQ